MKKMFLFVSMLLVLTISLSFTPVLIHAADSDKLAQESDFVGRLTCGSAAGDTKVLRFHENLPTFTSRMYDFMKILTPVIIIITGMLDIVKAVSAQKEDDIKKAQKKIIQRLIAGAIVFLVFVIVEFVVAFIADSGEVENAMGCVNCFLNGTMGSNGCFDVPTT